VALREIGATLKLDGEKEFRKGMDDAARGLRVLDSELKASSAAFAGNERSLESLTAKGKLFESKVAQQKKVVEALSRAVKESGQMYGEASAKTDGYKIKLNNATAALAKMERELKQNSQAIQGLGRDTDTAASKMEKLKRSAQQMADSLQNTGDKLTGYGRSMSMYVTAPIVAAGSLSFKAAAELEDAMGATDQIFKDSSDAMKAWAKDLESYYGIARGEAVEYSNMMGTMLINIGGLTEEEAAKQAQTLIMLAGDLTAMYGGTTADAVRALTGALKGNNTMLDNYGMAANDALIKTKAVEMGLIKEGGAMELVTKQAATLALIMEQSGAAQGQAAREAEGSSGAMRAFRTEMKNLSESFGEDLLPTITPFISKLNELIKSFSELSPATQKTIIATAGFAAALGPAMTVAGNLMKVTGGLIKLFTKFGGFTKILTSAAGFVAKFGGTLLNLATRIGPLVIQFAARLGPMIAGLSGPIGIAVAAVVALIAIFKKLWDTSPKFRNWVRGLADSLQNGLKGAINAVVDQLNWLIEKINKLPGIEINTVGKMTKSSGTTGWADFRQLPGNAAGTPFWRGGLTWVGERGPELLDIPRGSQIYNNQESRAIANQTLTVGGVIRVEGVNDMNQLVGVAQLVAREIEQGDRRLAGRVRVMPSMA
jgi:uncharacterized protein YoxC